MHRLEAAIERVVERMVAVYEAEERRVMEANKPDAAEVKAAFEALVESENFEEDVAAFEAAYPGEFAKRTSRALRG